MVDGSDSAASSILSAYQLLGEAWESLFPAVASVAPRWPAAATAIAAASIRVLTLGVSAAGGDGLRPRFRVAGEKTRRHRSTGLEGLG